MKYLGVCRQMDFKKNLSFFFNLQIVVLAIMSQAGGVRCHVTPISCSGTSRAPALSLRTGQFNQLWGISNIRPVLFILRKYCVSVNLYSEGLGSSKSAAWAVWAVEACRKDSWTLYNCTVHCTVYFTFLCGTAGHSTVLCSTAGHFTVHCSTAGHCTVHCSTAGH